MKIRNLLIHKSFWCDDRGNALALAAIMFPLIVGSAGLAVDTTQWVLTKRQIQQAADSAAIAGSNAAVQGGDVDYAVDQALAPTFAKIPKMSALSTLSPDDHDGDPYAVGVRLTALGALPFSSMFLSKPITISANATATVVETGDFCAFALGSSAEAGISLQPNTSVQAECGFATNSKSSNAVTADATSKMAVPRLLAFGGIEVGPSMAGSAARAYALKQKDPLAKIDPPDVPDTGCPNITVNSGQSGVKLQPGCYGNLVIDGDVTLEPGDYILNRGSLIVGPKADVTCNGCSIFLTSDSKADDDGSIGRAQIDKAASVKLSAPTNGPYAGVLLYQDRRAAPEVADQMSMISGSSTSRLEGAVYFPSQSVKLVGTGSSNFNCARIIGRHLIFDGEIFIAKSCSTDTGGITLKGSEVRLVD